MYGKDQVEAIFLRVGDRDPREVAKQLKDCIDRFKDRVKAKRRGLPKLPPLRKVLGDSFGDVIYYRPDFNGFSGAARAEITCKSSIACKSSTSIVRVHVLDERRVLVHAGRGFTSKGKPKDTFDGPRLLYSLDEEHRYGTLRTGAVRHLLDAARQSEGLPRAAVAGRRGNQALTLGARRGS